MMKQTIIIALAISSMAFAQRELKVKDLGKMGRESKEAQAKTTAVVAAGEVSAKAQKFARELGADATGIQKMIEKVPEMQKVIEDVIAKGDKEAMAIIAKSTRNAGTDANAGLDNAGVKKVMLSLNDMSKFGEQNGAIIKAEMASSSKSNHLALRDALAKTKQIRADSKEMDKTVREELPVCE